MRRNARNLQLKRAPAAGSELRGGRRRGSTTTADQHRYLSRNNDVGGGDGGVVGRGGILLSRLRLPSDFAAPPSPIEPIRATAAAAAMVTGLTADTGLLMMEQG